VDRQSPEEELVAFYAAKGDQVFSWDVTATLATSLKTYFESEGWSVTLSVGEGPRRRHFPRVSRDARGR